MCSTEESAVVTTVASPPKDVQIPKIEISQFDNEEMIPTCDILHNTTGRNYIFIISKHHEKCRLACYSLFLNRDPGDAPGKKGKKSLSLQ